MTDDHYSRYISSLGSILGSAQATDAAGTALSPDSAVKRMGREMRDCHDRGSRVLLVGNGGSAGICSHIATDLSKNGGIRATALNDGSALTCIGNDFGYDQVFAKQIQWHAAEGDILIAVSSSGRSPNILKAVEAGRDRSCTVFTLSGFSPDNPLRALGDLNVFLASDAYGFVEVGHLAILHAVLDINMGWTARH